MKRLLTLFAAALMLSALVGPSIALATNLSRMEAGSDMGKALEHRFGYPVRELDNQRPGAIQCEWRHYNRSRCAFGYVLGDTGIYGKGQVWISYCSRGPTGYCWMSYFRATVLNEYCLYVEHRSFNRCSRVVRQRW